MVQLKQFSRKLIHLRRLCRPLLSDFLKIHGRKGVYDPPLFVKPGRDCIPGSIESLALGS